MWKAKPLKMLWFNCPVINSPISPKHRPLCSSNLITRKNMNIKQQLLVEAKLKRSKGGNFLLRFSIILSWRKTFSLLLFFLPLLSSFNQKLDVQKYFSYLQFLGLSICSFSSLWIIYLLLVFPFLG